MLGTCTVYTCKLILRKSHLNRHSIYCQASHGIVGESTGLRTSWVSVDLSWMLFGLLVLVWSYHPLCGCIAYTLCVLMRSDANNITCMLLMWIDTFIVVSFFFPCYCHQQSTLRPPEVHIRTIHFNVNTRFVWRLWGLMIYIDCIF